jgi:hypothetical protein
MANQRNETMFSYIRLDSRIPKEPRMQIIRLTAVRGACGALGRLAALDSQAFYESAYGS